VDWIKQLRRLKQQEEENRRRRGEPEGHPPACFVGSTPIVLPEGTMSIQEIRPAVQVLSWSTPCSTYECAEVTHVHAALSNELILLTLENETLMCTPQHPFWHADRGWTAAGQLARFGSSTCAGRRRSARGSSGARACLQLDGLRCAPVLCWVFGGPGTQQAAVLTGTFPSWRNGHALQEVGC
jgi:hypothetical protein